MPELKCSVQTCVHNKQNYCDLDAIEVKGNTAQTAGETSCASFVEKKGNEYSNSMKEATPTSNIDCQARECLYNNSCKCNAGKINVAGTDACQSEDTECATFKKNN